MKLTIRFIFLSLALLSACTPAPTLTEPEKVEVYTAVIERIYTQDDTYGGTFQAADVYILTKTDDSVGDPNIEQSVSRNLSTAVRNDINIALKHLPAQLIWVEDKTAVPIDPTTEAVANNGVILTLGNIHSQRNGTVLVSASIYVGSLSAGGQTYILEKVDGGGKSPEKPMSNGLASVCPMRSRQISIVSYLQTLATLLYDVGD